MSAPYVFISYKSEEDRFARELAEALEARGLGAWAAFRDVRVSHAQEIPPAIRSASAVVILMSSTAYASDEVLDEVYLARQYKRLRLPVLLPGESEPTSQAGLSDGKKDAWALELTRRNYHRWTGAETAAAWIASAVTTGEPDADPVVAAETTAPSAAASTLEPPREPFALVSSLGQTYQLDAVHDGLGENLLGDGDRIATGDLGLLVIAPDGSVIATLNRDLEVAIWTLGSSDALPGPVLGDVLPAGDGDVRLLAIDRPIGQAIRLIAARGGSAYSVIQQQDGYWLSAPLLTGDDEFTGGAPIVDDLLLVRSGGETVWAGDHAKRPFGLRSIRGVDSAFGPDGRQYLAGWGTGMDGSPQVEAVVETAAGWERVHRGPGSRAGIVRVLRDAARQSPEPTPVAIAVESGTNTVELVAIGV